MLDRRITAVTDLWSSVVIVKHVYALTTSFFDITTQADYDDILVKDAKWVTNACKLQTVEPDDAIEVRNRRLFSATPFLGQRLWSLWWAYQALHGRVHYSLVQGVKRARVVHWTADPNVQKFFAVAISEQEYRELRATVPDFLLLSTIISRIETLMLSEIERVLSGRDVANQSVAEATTLAVRMAEARAAQREP